jgi:NADPH:quinone reductase-like Zn-dependent oxidoreductase
MNAMSKVPTSLCPHFLLMTNSTSQPSLTTDGTRQPYRAFLIDVTLEDGSTYALTRLRFSQFSALDARFKELYPMAHSALPVFPRKTIGKATEEQWRERVRALDLYFTGVLAMPQLAAHKEFQVLFKREEDVVDGMPALTYNLLGPPEQVLQVVNNLPKPAMPLRQNDVFIECFASSVNLVDLLMMEGASDLLEFVGVTSFPFTPGVDVCGIVRGTGSAVTAFKLGDAVYADTGITNGGAMAQFVTVPDSQCCKKPKNLSFVEAAAFPHAGLIAYQTLVYDCQIDQKPEGRGKRLLIVGGHTGTGSIAIQVGKYFGAHVTCTVIEGAEDWVRRLGADAAVVTSMWWEHVYEGKFDAVFDCVGEVEGFEKAKAILAGDSGVYATVRPDGLRDDVGSISSWLKTGAVTIGRKILSIKAPKYHNAWANPKSVDLEKLRVLIEGGDMKTIANHYFPLKRAVEAFNLLKNSKNIGKVVIIIKEDLVQPEQEFGSSIMMRGQLESNTPAVSSPNRPTSPVQQPQQKQESSPSAVTGPSIDLRSPPVDKSQPVAPESSQEIKVCLFFYVFFFSS